MNVEKYEMSTKKALILTLGFLVVMSGFLTICFDWLPFFAIKMTSFLLVRNLLSAASIFPRGFPWLFSRLFAESMAIYLLILFWMIIVVVSGIGILRLSNFARLFFVSLNIIHLIVFLFSSISMGVHQIRMADINYLYVVLFPIVYICFLCNPKVKLCFVSESHSKSSVK